MEYRRFAFRTFFRWGFLILAGVLVFAAPLSWWLYWKDFRKDTIDALNTSASYRHSPGSADAATWHMAEQWPWVMVVFILVFLVVLYIWRWARPSNDPAHHD
jgi:H+/Cl- antiporter ClcA